MNKIKIKRLKITFKLCVKKMYKRGNCLLKS